MDDDNEFDLLLESALCLAAVEAVEIIEKEEAKRLKDHINEQRRLCRSLPAEKTRPTWAGFCNRVSDSHFRRQFRMTRNAFTNLCTILSAAIGQDTFRSENSPWSTNNSASLQARGGLIAGEVKVALSLRLLAGGSYLDLMPLFDVSVPHIYVIFDQFLGWVIKAFDLPLPKTGRNLPQLQSPFHMVPMEFLAALLVPSME